MNDIIEPTDIATKPSYDGRLHYYKILLDIFGVNIAMSIMNDDYANWIKSLKGYVAMASVTMTKKQIKEINDKMNIINNFMIDPKLENALRRKLHETTQHIFYLSRNLLLPLKSEDDEELDIDRWLAESDM